MRAVALRLSTSIPSPPTPCADRDRILRFRRSERLVHWALAVPFMVCYSTALILVVVYNPNPTRPFRQVVSWTHRMSGLCLFVLPLWTLVRNRHEAWLHAHNIRQVWHWTLDDLKWLALIGPASISRGIALPHQGKFNAGEKINFMSVSSTYSIYILTGLGIWLGVAPVPCWLVHFSLAACATPLLLGHIMMATVNPDTRPGLTGMITGFVDREWAKHHYHLWYHEHYGRHTSTEAMRHVLSERSPLAPLPVPTASVAAPAAGDLHTADEPAGAGLRSAAHAVPGQAAGTRTADLRRHPAIPPSPPRPAKVGLLAGAGAGVPARGRAAGGRAEADVADRRADASATS